MTVSYQYEVASSTSGGFTRLLFKWKGSLYKLVYRELFVFCLVYGVMSCVYRYFFNTTQKRSFEKVVMYCDTYMNYIPLSFILGFYVSFVASRWWQQYMAIPWPDKIIHAIALHVVGYDEKGRMMRRALVRYLNLSLVLILRSISSAVKKRFPTLEHLVEAGFITSTELGIYNLVPNTEFNTYWIPCTWFTALLKDAKAQKRITDPLGIKHIMEEFNEFRQKCGFLELMTECVNPSSVHSGFEYRANVECSGVTIGDASRWCTRSSFRRNLLNVITHCAVESVVEFVVGLLSVNTLCLYMTMFDRVVTR
nr:bestrophin-2-like [Penaeus vannamei]